MALAKRLSTAILAFAFLVGLTMQAVLPARAAAMPKPMSAAGMPGHSDERPLAPCKPATPLCVDHVGCVTVIAVPSSPAAMGVPIRWRAIRYELAASSLTGRSVEPELSPPILAA
jgi:hypothetical protein